mmetsp:Transcript_15657/g.39857  ORF Transcript_15657/g.39857 Transcript_15657/m.39857 type:complete len:288 (+) Transcript_15657:1063-1926(+)
MSPKVREQRQRPGGNRHVLITPLSLSGHIPVENRTTFQPLNKHLEVFAILLPSFDCCRGELGLRHLHPGAGRARSDKASGRYASPAPNLDRTARRSLHARERIRAPARAHTANAAVCDSDLAPPLSCRVHAQRVASNGCLRARSSRLWHCLVAAGLAALLLLAALQSLTRRGRTCNQQGQLFVLHFHICFRALSPLHSPVRSRPCRHRRCSFVPSPCGFVCPSALARSGTGGRARFFRCLRLCYHRFLLQPQRGLRRVFCFPVVLERAHAVVVVRHLLPRLDVAHCS